MPDLSVTSILDPLVEGWAREAGIATKELSGILGTDIAGGIIGLPLDMFLTQLGSKIASLFIGAAGLLFGTYSMKGQGRMQLDVMGISSRVMTEVLDPSPQQIKEIQRNISDLIDGAVAGRWDKVAYAIVRNPREFTGLVPSAEKKEPAKKEQPAEQSQPEQPIPRGQVIRL